MATLLSLLIGLLALALMITIHEAGHFVMARLLKIEVEVFAIGFGKALKKWQSGRTEIRFNIFPLGGYCRLKGADELKEALDRGDDYLKGAQEGSLFKAHPFKRILTYLGGPLFNLLFALLLFILFFALPSLGWDDSNQVVVSSDYPTLFGLSGDERVAAEEAGILTGDTIVKIDGVETPDFYTIQTELSKKRVEEVVEFTLLRQGEEIKRTTSGEWDEAAGKVLFGVSVFLSNRVAEVDPLSPEALASLTPGDQIVEIEGVTVTNALDFLEELTHQEAPIILKVEDIGGNIREITYNPQIDSQGLIKVGFTFERNQVKQPGSPLWKAIKMGFLEEYHSIKETLLLFPKIFKGAFKFDEVVGGPIRISYIIGESRRSGFSSLVHLLALVSASLAIANLLPLPGLDGGAIILNLIELIRGRSLSVRLYVKTQAVGLIILVLLMVFVILGDFRFLFLGG